MNQYPLEPKRIGGWLIGVALSIALTLIFNINTFFQDMIPAFNHQTWIILTNPESSSYHEMWAPLLVYDLVILVIYIGMNTYLLFL